MKRLNKNTLARFLIGLLSLLLGLHLLTAYFSIHHPDSFLADANVWFDFDREYNVPAIVSTVLLALIARSCYGLYKKAKSKQGQLWRLLAYFFGLLAFDEFFSIHEDLATPMRELLSINRDSILWQAWVIPAAVGIVLFVVGLRFVLRRLKVGLTRSQKQVITITIIYLVGVLVLESIGTQAEKETTYRLVIIPIEEMYELIMASILLWITWTDK